MKIFASPEPQKELTHANTPHHNSLSLFGLFRVFVGGGGRGRLEGWGVFFFFIFGFVIAATVVVHFVFLLLLISSVRRLRVCAKHEV